MFATGVSAVGTRYNLPRFFRVVAFRHAVILVLEFRKLPHADQAMFADHERRRHFRVAVLRDVQIQQKLNQRPFQPRAPIRVEQKAAAGKFRRAGEIHQLERLAQLDVRLGLEGEIRLRAMNANFRIVFRRFAKRAPIHAADSAIAASAHRAPLRFRPPVCPARRFFRPDLSSPLFSPRPRRVFSGPSARRSPCSRDCAGI